MSAIRISKARVNLGDNRLEQAMIQDSGYKVVDKGSISNATVTFDYTAGSVQNMDIGRLHGNNCH